ncbi:phosphoribosylglycinamide formyltransferase [Odoribacter laneus]|jgi:phosphoribosylglycinamide formyltransferase|uniref:Phosphoribosylglycinamide formyltransferase n=1 Tax=Odoribacter laneus YIT 12061 TaxID=742817 RepID=H1DK37_9BACT|nr:phosphoribosylglycinamide formyltransferase [Odoribacter laneus]MBS1444715.1 phosphoribosylglycinamide formyltransferase [Odoribacter sp.]EHP45651.1 phosphoribosylglycinamide formyltransferase [Odoribacter laneus YIT 12061]CCZ80894.1 phosphoribosylglycinamide formyltransferase [Odoribacter laneus CAG:561]GKI23140.1 phosphoribosylglycinamide formyltransferase [Odoribacter laneus]GKI26932.1 phosphoribosylglycinamide formyltransferase [Odoribacter laneus]
MKKIAIFASGSGSNAENIIQYFLSKPEISVDSVFCNVAEAYVLKRAEKYNIPTFLFNREDLKNQEKVLQILQERQIDFIVLAGFLWLMPSFIVSAFPNRIINIHPALLPHHGGKGMYGMKVHEAVIAAGEKESGITIHYINNQYDKGDPIFQARCPVEAGETPESLAKKVHALEYAHFPRVIEEILQNLKS